MALLQKWSFLRLLYSTALVGLCFESQIWQNHFYKAVDPWMAFKLMLFFPLPLVFTEMNSLNWLSEIMGTSSSLYLWLDALYNISYVASKGKSHRGFSRFKRTVIVPGKPTFWMYGHWTWDHPWWDFKRIQEFALYPTQ